jgi:hypothetical protein
MKNRSVLFLVFCLFVFSGIVSSVCGQSVDPMPSPPTKDKSLDGLASKSNNPSVLKDAASEEIQDLTARILKLEIEIIKSKSQNEENGTAIAVIAGFAALIAALIGGGLTLLGQHMTAKRDLELARKQAVFQQTENILEFRIKQMELFYAPMFALLKQSTALYNRMCDQLVQDEPARYRALAKPDSDGYSYHVLAKDGIAWKGFRLLDQMPAVKKNAKALTLATEILCIGGQTTKIISEHAGLASSELIELLGEYLAHYALLSTVYKSIETEPWEPLGQRPGYFSRELSVKIEHEYRELSKFLDEFETASKKMLASIQI